MPFNSTSNEGSTLLTIALRPITSYKKRRPAIWRVSCHFDCKLLYQILILNSLGVTILMNDFECQGAIHIYQAIHLSKICLN